MHLLVVLFAFGVSYVRSESVPFESCQGLDTVLGIAITPCNAIQVEGWKTCVFHHDKVVKVEAAVIAPFSTSQLEANGHAVINGHLLPLPGAGSNPCVDSVSPGCPIQNGRMYIFTFHFNVFKYYPTGRMEIIFNVKDRKTKTVAGCVRLPIVIHGLAKN